MDFNFEKMNGEAIELLQKLIRNKCVGTENPDSGNEMRSVNTLIEYFESYDIKNYEIFKTNDERGNLLVKIKGSDPNAHSLIYESHLDVVPVNADEWEVDPFEGKIIDEYVWGRGTIDMLYYTATQAVAFANLHKNGFKPKGDLLFLAVADEESGAKYGARWLIENVKDKLLSNDTYLIGEFGGAALNTPKGVKIGLMNAEKGPAWFEMKIKGTPGHASMTYKQDNAIFKASKILNLIQNNPPKPYFSQSWKEFIQGLDLGKISTFMLTHKLTLPIALKSLAKKDLGMARAFHGLTHMTINPTIVRAGEKVNIIPDGVKLSFDVRVLPDQNQNTVVAYLKKTLGNLFEDIEIEFNEMSIDGSSDSWDVPLIPSIQRVYNEVDEGEIVPFFLPAVTDSRIFRQIGIKCYGFSVLTEKVTTTDLTSLAHGHNERIPLISIKKTMEFFSKLPLDFLA